MLSAIFLALSRRQEDRQDLHGQLLPDTVFAIAIAIEQAPPYRTQGLCGETKRVRIRKQWYFAKMTDETLSGHPMPGEEDFNAVTANAAIRALQPLIVPQETYHFIAADGSQCTFVSAFGGRTYISRPSAAAHVAPLVDLIWLQWVVIAEWLFGVEDRLAGNLVVDKARRCVGMIDLTYAWQFRSTFLGWNNEQEDGFRQCLSFAYEMWELLDPFMVFPRHLIEESCAREAAVIDALATFPMPTATLTSLARQFQMLRAALDHRTGDIPLMALEQLAQS
jgi:hypothetical protein